MSAATEHPEVAAALHGRHFLTLTDYSADEIRYLLDLSAELKAASARAATSSDWSSRRSR